MKCFLEWELFVPFSNQKPFDIHEKLVIKWPLIQREHKGTAFACPQEHTLLRHVRGWPLMVKALRLFAVLAHQDQENIHREFNYRKTAHANNAN
jgi:hypothetical protein